MLQRHSRQPAQQQHPRSQQGESDAVFLPLVSVIQQVAAAESQLASSKTSSQLAGARALCALVEGVEPSSAEALELLSHSGTSLPARLLDLLAGCSSSSSLAGGGGRHAAVKDVGLKAIEALGSMFELGPEWAAAIAAQLTLHRQRALVVMAAEEASRSLTLGWTLRLDAVDRICTIATFVSRRSSLHATQSDGHGEGGSFVVLNIPTSAHDHSPSAGAGEAGSGSADEAGGSRRGSCSQKLLSSMLNSLSLIPRRVAAARRNSRRGSISSVGSRGSRNSIGSRSSIGSSGGNGTPAGHEALVLPGITITCEECSLAAEMVSILMPLTDNDSSILQAALDITNAAPSVLSEENLSAVLEWGLGSRLLAHMRIIYDEWDEREHMQVLSYFGKVLHLCSIVARQASAAAAASRHHRLSTTAAAAVGVDAAARERLLQLRASLSRTALPVPPHLIHGSGSIGRRVHAGGSGSSTAASVHASASANGGNGHALAPRGTPLPDVSAECHLLIPMAWHGSLHGVLHATLAPFAAGVLQQAAFNCSPTRVAAFRALTEYVRPALHADALVWEEAMAAATQRGGSGAAGGGSSRCSSASRYDGNEDHASTSSVSSPSSSSAHVRQAAGTHAPSTHTAASPWPPSIHMHPWSEGPISLLLDAMLSHACVLPSLATLLSSRDRGVLGDCVQLINAMCPYASFVAAACGGEALASAGGPSASTPCGSTPTITTPTTSTTAALPPPRRMTGDASAAAAAASGALSLSPAPTPLKGVGGDVQMYCYEPSCGDGGGGGTSGAFAGGGHGVGAVSSSTRASRSSVASGAAGGRTLLDVMQAALQDDRAAILAQCMASSAAGAVPLVPLAPRPPKRVQQQAQTKGAGGPAADDLGAAAAAGAASGAAESAVAASPLCLLRQLQEAVRVVCCKRQCRQSGRH